MGTDRRTYPTQTFGDPSARLGHRNRCVGSMLAPRPVFSLAAIALVNWSYAETSDEAQASDGAPPVRLSPGPTARRTTPSQRPTSAAHAGDSRSLLVTNSDNRAGAAARHSLTLHCASTVEHLPRHVQLMARGAAQSTPWGPTDPHQPRPTSLPCRLPFAAVRWVMRP